MSDRPEYDQEKNYADHRAKWYDEPKFYMSELEFLEQKIEAKLDTINEQLSALFQLSTKFLKDSIDFTIKIDNINKELRDRAGAEVMHWEHITDLYDQIFEIEKLNPEENHHIKDLQDKPNNE